MEVKLLPNLPAFKSFSMRRYQEELLKALLAIAGDDEKFDEFDFSRRLFVSTGKSSRFLLRFDRWITYPMVVSTSSPGNFHILDQSHAHLALCLGRSRCVITCHDLMPLRDALNLSPVKTTTFRKDMLHYLIKGLQRADHIIADSIATKEDLVNLAKIPEGKITVIYLGRNELFKAAPDRQTRENERAAVVNKFGISPSAFILFHLGTGSPVKNTSAILQAMSKSSEPLVLLRAGADLNNDERELLEKCGLQDRYRYVGEGLSDNELARLYRIADVFVFPSFWEGFGWPPIESMSSGTPVVCSNIGSLNEVVGDAALKVDPYDYAGLSSAISRLLSNEKLKSDMIAAGLERAERFRWSETAKQVREVYRREFA